VAEVTVAHSIGLRAVGVSCVANRVPMWGHVSTLTHCAVVACVESAVERLKRLILRWSGMVADDANR